MQYPCRIIKNKLISYCNYMLRILNVKFKMLCHQNDDSYYKDETVSPLSYFYDKNSNTWRDSLNILRQARETVICMYCIYQKTIDDESVTQSHYWQRDCLYIIYAFHLQWRPLLPKNSHTGHWNSQNSTYLITPKYNDNCCLARVITWVKGHYFITTVHVWFFL